MEYGATQKTTQKTKTWWLYLLECKHNRLYTGIALDVHARFALHASGKGAKFTRANPPISILAAQPFESRSAALKAEHALKKLTATQKRLWADAVCCASC